MNDNDDNYRINIMKKLKTNTQVEIYHLFSGQVIADLNHGNISTRTLNNTSL